MRNLMLSSEERDYQGCIVLAYKRRIENSLRLSLSVLREVFYSFAEESCKQDCIVLTRK